MGEQGDRTQERADRRGWGALNWTLTTVGGLVLATIASAIIVPGCLEGPKLKAAHAGYLRLREPADGGQGVWIWVRNDGKKTSTLSSMVLTVKDYGVLRCCAFCVDRPVTRAHPNGMPARPGPNQSKTFRFSRSVKPGETLNRPQNVPEPDPKSHHGAVYLYRVAVAVKHDDDPKALALGTAILTVPRTPMRVDVNRRPGYITADSQALGCYARNRAVLDNMLSGPANRARGLKRFGAWLRQTDRTLAPPAPPSDA